MLGKNRHQTILQKNSNHLTRLLTNLQNNAVQTQVNRHVETATWRFIAFVSFIILSAGVRQIDLLIIMTLVIVITVALHSINFISMFIRRFLPLFVLGSLFIIPAIFMLNITFAERFLLRLAVNLALLVIFQLTTPLTEILQIVHELGLSDELVITINIALITITSSATELLKLLEVRKIRTIQRSSGTFKNTVLILGPLLGRIQATSQAHANGLRVRHMLITKHHFKVRYLFPICLACFIVLFI